MKTTTTVEKYNHYKPPTIPCSTPVTLPDNTIVGWRFKIQNCVESSTKACKAGKVDELCKNISSAETRGQNNM